MTKLQAWIHAFRLRTLPLAVSSIIMGAFLAFHHNAFRWDVSILAVLTTLLLQILSNLANDYGDSSHGVDNTDRIGPTRAVQSGTISSKEMKRAVIFFSGLALILGISLLISSLGNALLSPTFLIFLVIGIAAILSAIKYTVGKNPYGYSGFGDLFVFLFFGLTGVGGTYYLNTLHLSWEILLPAISLGMFSTGVLNLNNMRDFENDKANKKHTLVVKLGLQRSKKYHTILISLGMISAVLYSILNLNNFIQLLYILTFLLFLKNINTVLKINDPHNFDPLLKQLALSTLIFTICFGICGSF